MCKNRGRTCSPPCPLPSQKKGKKIARKTFTPPRTNQFWEGSIVRLLNLSRDFGQVHGAAFLEGEVARHRHLKGSQAVVARGADLATLLQDLAERLRCIKKTHVSDIWWFVIRVNTVCELQLKISCLCWLRLAAYCDVLKASIHLVSGRLQRGVPP